MQSKRQGEGTRTFSLLDRIFNVGPLLSPTQLKRLNEHKYSCQSASILEPFMQKWWNWVVQQLPLWLAPNLITITGLFVNIVTSLILVYYSPDGKQEAPSFAPLLCALGIFIYQTLDAIDGKQARRTGSSSPLGELFDHGCDSLSTVFVALAACLTVGLGAEPWWMFFQCFTGFTLFYCAHWQTYVSGTLRFGKVDVTEAQFGIITLHMITFFFGRDVWEIHFPVLELEIKFIVSILVNALGFYTFCTEYIMIILNGGAGRNGSTIAGTSVISPAIPFAFVVVPAYIIACKSEDHIFEQHPALYILAFGLVAAKVTNRLVVAHMTRSEMEYLDSILLGPLLLFLNQYFNNFFSEYWVLWACLILATWDLTRYCRCVCLEIARHLCIQVFRIVPKPPSATTNSTVVPSAAGPAAPAAHILTTPIQASSSANGSRNGRHRQK